MDTPHAGLDFSAMEGAAVWRKPANRQQPGGGPPVAQTIATNATSSPAQAITPRKSVTFAEPSHSSDNSCTDMVTGSAQRSELSTNPSNVTVVARNQASAPSADYCMLMEPHEQEALSNALIQDTVSALPVQPDKISNIRGPYMEMRSVDPSTLDVEVTHQFRAHFDPDAIKHAATALPLGTSVVPHSTPQIVEVDAAAQQQEQLQRPPSTSSRYNSQDSAGKIGISPGDSEHVSHTSSLSDPEADSRFDYNLSQIDAPRRIASDHGQRVRSHWEIDPSEIVIGERLAVGGFAEVFIGKYQGTLIAVKLLLNVDDIGRQRFKQEVELLASLRHPNLILFMGFCMEPHLALVTEFMHRGSLFKVLRKGGDKPLDHRLQKSVAISVARGMAYLHTRSPPLLHMDLKSPNILIDDKWRIKVADFGLSRVMHNTYMSAGAGAGTPEWMAPCVLRSEKHDAHADVYSYGVVLWECLTGQVPWENMHPMQVVGAVGFQGKQLPLPTQGDPFLIDLCRRCMSLDALARPTFPQIVQEIEEHYAPGSSSSMHHTLSQSTVRLSSGSGGRNFAAGQGMGRSIPSPGSVHKGGASSNESGPPAMFLSRQSSQNERVGGAATGSSSESVPRATGTIPEEGRPSSSRTSVEEAAPVVLHPAKSLSNASPFAQLLPFSDEDDEESEHANASVAATKPVDQHQEDKKSPSRRSFDTNNAAAGASPNNSASRIDQGNQESIIPAMQDLSLKQNVSVFAAAAAESGPLSSEGNHGPTSYRLHRLDSLDTKLPGASRGFKFDNSLQHRSEPDGSMNDFTSEDTDCVDISTATTAETSIPLPSDVMEQTQSGALRLSVTTADSLEVPSFSSSLEVAAFEAAKLQAAAGGHPLNVPGEKKHNMQQMQDDVTKAFDSATL